MSGRFLLDTNIIIVLFAHEASIETELANAEEVYTSDTVLGELYFGARKSGKINQNLARVDAYAATNKVLSANLITAQQYGVIKNQLRLQGTPIPENDIWIAALATQYSLIVVTRDQHFLKVKNLQVVQW